MSTGRRAPASHTNWAPQLIDNISHIQVTARTVCYPALRILAVASYPLAKSTCQFVTRSHFSPPENSGVRSTRILTGGLPANCLFYRRSRKAGTGWRTQPTITKTRDTSYQRAPYGSLGNVSIPTHFCHFKGKSEVLAYRN